MPRIQDPTHYYLKAEVYGFPNTGKSVFGFSVVNLPPLIPTKKDVVIFTNQSLYTETLELFSPEAKEQFVIYLHRTLEEFEHDWDTFCKEYGYGVKADTRGRIALTDDSGIREKVHAIVIDEGDFIYHDGYVARYAEELGAPLIPKQYGVPRKNFRMQINRMASLPCHFILCSNAGWEWESSRYEKRDGTEGSLQFKKTGSDTYQLPDQMLYMPSLSMHLFMHEKPVFKDWKNDKDGKTYKVQQVDELNRKKVDRKYYGEARKQKANREVDFIIQNPTIVKVLFHLNKIRKETRIQ